MPGIPSHFRHLVVIHHHLRPGGVRRILELALPRIVGAPGSAIARITLVSGEKADAAWLRALRRSLRGKTLRAVTDPAFLYLSEQRRRPAGIGAAVQAALGALKGPAGKTLVWVQNPGVGRNLLVPARTARWTRDNGAALVFHHHDFWFENRWSRWHEMRSAGFPTLARAGSAIFAAGAGAVHLTINRHDLVPLHRQLPGRSHWLPNLVPREKPPPRARVAAARRWLDTRTGGGKVWIFPTRFLRRKNLAEAILLTRWLRPDATLVTTAGVSSAGEAPYASALENAARRHRWRVRFRVLDGAPRSAPSVAELVATSETVLLTSAQEGFGLPYLEAAAAGRPLIARRLPNVVPDIEKFGFRLPNLYDEVLIDPSLIDLNAERRRQREAWRRWQSSLPAACRRLAGVPTVLLRNAKEPLPFSRLTLAGQLEVLAIPPEESWTACRSWNPQLTRWRPVAGSLPAARWPRRAEKFIGGPAYAQNFWRAVAARPSTPADPAPCARAQEEFIRERLGTAYLYPILFGGV